jgi:outer membrane protein OmpA-like peptidoglycan-associated protein
MKRPTSARPVLLLAALVTGLLAACGSAPKAIVPDGSHRRDINTPGRINEYRYTGSTDIADPPRPSGERRRIEALEMQVAALYKAMLTVSDTSRFAPPPRPQGCAVTSAPASAEADAACPAPCERIELRPRSVVFHITFGLGTADFKPTQFLRRTLLKVTADSPRIEVRGRTDADKAGRADALLALQRAQSARQFLIRQGIDPARIHTSALAAGGRVADNDSEAGRAQNRRVEIEAMDVDPQTYALSPHLPTGAEHEPD